LSFLWRLRIGTPSQGLEPGLGRERNYSNNS